MGCNQSSGNFDTAEVKVLTVAGVIPESNLDELRKISNKTNQLFRAINNQKKRSVLFDSLKLYFTNIKVALEIKVQNPEFILNDEKSLSLQKKILQVEEFIDQLESCDGDCHFNFITTVTGMTQEINRIVDYILGDSERFEGFEISFNKVKDLDEHTKKRLVEKANVENQLQQTLFFQSIFAENFWITNYGGAKYIEIDRDLKKLPAYLTKIIDSIVVSESDFFYLMDSDNLSLSHSQFDKFFINKVWDVKTMLAKREKAKEIGSHKLVLNSLPCKTLNQPPINITFHTSGRHSNESSILGIKRNLSTGAFIFGEETKDNNFVSIPDITYASAAVSTYNSYIHENFFKIFIHSSHNRTDQACRSIFCVSDLALRSYSKILIEEKLPIPLHTDHIVDLGNDELFAVTVGDLPKSHLEATKTNLLNLHAKSLNINFHGIIDEEEKDHFEGIRLKCLKTGEILQSSPVEGKHCITQNQSSDRFKIENSSIQASSTSKIKAYIEIENNAWTIRGVANYNADKHNSFLGPYLLFRIQSELSREFPSAPVSLAENMHFKSGGLVFWVKEIKGH